MPKIATVSGPPLALCQAVATPQTDCFDTTNLKFIYGGNEIYRPTWQYEYPIVKVATHGLAKISVLRVWLHNVCLHKQQKPLWSPTQLPGTPSCKSDYSASDCPLHPASTEPCAPYNALQCHRGKHLKKLLYTAPPLASHQGDILSRLSNSDNWDFNTVRCFGAVIDQSKGNFIGCGHYWSWKEHYHSQ